MTALHKVALKFVSIRHLRPCIFPVNIVLLNIFENFDSWCLSKASYIMKDQEYVVEMFKVTFMMNSEVKW